MDEWKKGQKVLDIIWMTRNVMIFIEIQMLLLNGHNEIHFETKLAKS